MDKKRSDVWKFFEIIDDKKTKCNFCQQEVTGVVTSMKKHLISRHPTENMVTVKVEGGTHWHEEDDSADGFSSSPEKRKEAAISESTVESLMQRKKSFVWKFFDIVNEKRTVCKLCKKEQSSIISNMKKHLRVKHPTANDVKGSQNWVAPDETSNDSLPQPEDNQMDVDMQNGDENDVDNVGESTSNNVMIKIEEISSFLNLKKRSEVWGFFEKISEKRAICKICHKEQSSVTTNLKKHLEIRHPREHGVLGVIDSFSSNTTQARFNDDDSSDFYYPDETPSSSISSSKRNGQSKKSDVIISKRLIGSKPTKTADDLMQRKRSSVWKYFQILNTKRAKCNICGKEQSSVISNVKKHLSCTHPKAFLEMRGGKRVPMDTRHTNIVKNKKKRRRDKVVSYAEDDSNDSIQEVPSSSTSPIKYKKPRSERRLETEIISIQPADPTEILEPTKYNKISNKADQILLKLIIKHFQDYSIVQEDEIKSFIKTINISYKLPSKETIANTLIPDLYEKCLFQTKLKLKSCKRACLSIESWSNIHATQFTTVTVHFLGEEFQLISILLECSVAQTKDSASMIANELKTILKQWKIREDHILLAILDINYANMKSVFNEELKWDSFDCFANTINVLAKDCFNNEWIKTIIDKVKDIVSHFKGCEFSTENLTEYQKNLGVEPLKLVKDFPKCWNSTFHMLQRFVELEDAINHSLDIIDKGLQTLSIVEWQIIRQLVTSLKPMDTVMSTIKNEKYCPASLVIPLVIGLRNVYYNLSTKQFHNPVKDVLINIMQNIGDSFDNVENIDAFALASFLDPRFKNKAFSSNDVANNVKDRIINTLALKYGSGELQVINKEDDTHNDETCIWSFFDKSSPSDESASSSRISIEMQRFLEDGVISRSESPFKWWQANKVTYPHLAEVARERLCVVASSVPCDRYYRKRSLTAIENRSRLSTKKTQMLVFLNANYLS